MTVEPDREGGSALRRRRLLCVFSQDPSIVGRSVVLPPAGLEIGRQAGGLAVADSRMSRLHVRITATPRTTQSLVEDCGAKNGVFINGARAGRCVVQDGDVIRAGDSLFVYGPEVRASDGEPRGADRFRGDSAAAHAVRRRVAQVAASRAAVTLLGPSGSGKDVLANLLHELSERRGPFIPVNCAAIPKTLALSELFGHTRGAYTGATTASEGLIAASDGGTLFLDEVAELDLTVQAALLRTLDSGEVLPVGASRARRVDLRVVSATNADLDRAVRDGRFRSDLAMRMVRHREIYVPPLKERREDILSLVCLLAGVTALGLTPDAAEALVIGDWPGNVRELSSVVEALPADGRWDLSALPDELRAPIRTRRRPTRPPAAGGRPDQHVIQHHLACAQGNVAQVARDLGVHAKQLYRWMHHYAIDPGDYR